LPLLVLGNSILNFVFVKQIVDAKALFSNIDATSLDQVSVDQNVLIPEATPTVVVIDEAKEQQEREEIEKVRKKKKL
jgi:hypothetical protein